MLSCLCCLFPRGDSNPAPPACQASAYHYATAPPIVVRNLRKKGFMIGFATYYLSLLCISLCVTSNTSHMWKKTNSVLYISFIQSLFWTCGLYFMSIKQGIAKQTDSTLILLLGYFPCVFILWLKIKIWHKLSYVCPIIMNFSRCGI